MNAILNGTFVISVLASTLALATPLILGALGGVVSERAGVVNIALEGIMLVAAFVCAAVGTITGNLWLALLVGIVAGAVAGLFLALLAVTLRVDQVVAGFVINIAAAGGTSFVFRSTFANGSASPPTLAPINIPLLSAIPVLGPIVFRQSLLVYVALALVPLVHVYLFRTRAGLRSRAVSENPRAADVAGINVYLVRYAAVIVSGAFAGLAGAYLVADVGSFSEGMTSGRGFIALAAVIFGKWRPFQATLGALLFGFFDALQSQLQVAGINAPVPVLLMIPYLATIVVLAGFIGRAIPPAADGIPYVKE
jgi:general nucleoside transport system permease protein